MFDTIDKTKFVFIAFISVLLDVGDPELLCRFCKSKMWIGERVDDRKNPTTAEFSLCCMNGKVELPLLTKPPEPLYSLLNGDHVQSSNYLDNIRTYNSMFSFTSIGGRIDKKMNDGGGPPQFTLSGQNFHRMGSLKPEEGGTPKFAQLYIYDTQNETANRMKYFRYIH
jgi:hypothetical protein